MTRLATVMQGSVRPTVEKAGQLFVCHCVDANFIQSCG
jgi:hypothetical protein